MYNEAKQIFDKPADDMFAGLLQVAFTGALKETMRRKTLFLFFYTVFSTPRNR